MDVPGSPQRITAAERRAMVVDLRRQRLSFEQIGQRIGVSKQRAWEVYREALTAIPAAQIDEHRAEELQQLDYLSAKAIEVLERQHVTVSNGRVVNLNDEPIEDDAPVLAAIGALLKIQERKAKLLGLDAPSKHEVVTIDAIDAQIAELTAALAGGVEVEEASAASGVEG